MNGLRLVTDDLDVVAFLFIDGIDQFLIDIDKSDLIAGSDEQFPDKPTTDIPCAKMYCLFHDVLPP